MNKKALLMLPISLIVISTASCSWYIGETDYPSTQNPSRYFSKRMENGEHYIEYKNELFREDFVDTVISKLNHVEFTYLNNTPELSKTTFSLALEHPSFIVRGYHYISFYENGVASTSRYDTKEEKHYTYFYQFDIDVAKKVCEYVDNEYNYIKEKERQEEIDRDNTELEYNQMIEDMTLEAIIDMMGKDENARIEFAFKSPGPDWRVYTYYFKDDGSIYNALKNATFGKCEQYPTDSWDHVFISSNQWTIKIYKDTKAIAAFFLTFDKYGRSYDYQVEKSIDDASLDFIMNRAYELGSPKNPYQNSSSNPSSNSEEEQAE